MSPELASKITILSGRLSLSLQHRHWERLRAATTSGYAVLDSAIASRGEGVFWHESTKLPGVVYLFKPGRVIDELERLVGRTKNEQMD